MGRNGKCLLGALVMGAMACAEGESKDQRTADLETELAACRTQLAEAEAAASASSQPRFCLPPGQPASSTEGPPPTSTAAPGTRRGLHELGF